MTNSSASSSVVNVHWPLYTVYPAAIVFFYCAYFLFIPLGIRLCCQKRFNVLTRLNKRCFIQNINSCLHAFAIVSSLFIVLAGDHEMREAGVAPHYNVLAYCEVCVSLGYMSFVLPWSGDRRHVGRGLLEGQVVVPVVLPGGGAREAPRAPEAARGAQRAQARA